MILSINLLIKKSVMMMSSELETQIWQALHKVIDPELGIDIVKLGLIYKVVVKEKHDEPSSELSTTGSLAAESVEILMTLTTPGCPLAAVFDSMLRDALFGIPGLDPDHDVKINLTFDPPWVPDMMDEEAKAELGF